MTIRCCRAIFTLRSKFSTEQSVECLVLSLFENYNQKINVCSGQTTGIA